MLYLLVRPIARYVLRYYYRHIDLTGLENIPKEGAVILAANHPTAFIEPCVLACFQPRTLWFLARGNLFKAAWQRAFLAAVNILPVFRLEDGGYAKLKDNFRTFDACFKALSKGKAIMNLAEGRCVHEKALRPLRKGTARLALGALHRDSTLREVYIVPVGCNFTAADRVRGQVLIRCGEPILASTFMDEFRRNEATAIKNLTSHLRARLSPLVVQFPDRKVAGIGEARLELDRAVHHENQTYGLTHNGAQLDRELALAASTPEEDPAITRLFNRLTQQHIHVSAVAGAKVVVKEVGAAGVWLKSAGATALLLPQLPLWLLSEFIGSSQPKHVEFYSPVRFAVVSGGTLLVYPIALLLLPWVGKVWLVASLLTVRPALRQMDTLRWWWERRKAARLVAAEGEILREMLGCIPGFSRMDNRTTIKS